MFLLTAAGQVVLLQVPASVRNILLGMCVCVSICGCEQTFAYSWKYIYIRHVSETHGQADTKQKERQEGIQIYETHSFSQS